MNKPKPAESKRYREYLPKNSSEIKNVCTPIEYVQAGEKLLDKIKKEQMQSAESEKCKRCYGKGYAYNGLSTYVTCPACHGTGRKMKEQNK